MKYIPDEGMDLVIECMCFQNDHLRKSGIKNAKQLRNQRLKTEASKIKKDLISSVGKCEICGFDYKPILQVHHIVPISQFGNNQADNVMCVCPNCHKTLHHMYSILERNINTSISPINSTYGSNVTEKMWDVLFRYIIGKGAIVDYFESIGLIDSSDE